MPAITKCVWLRPIQALRAVASLSPRSLLLCGATALAQASPAVAENWTGLPPSNAELLLNDFGGIGLIQTPTARFAPEGQAYAGASYVSPYTRYYVTLQGTSWLEATLRYSSVSNRQFTATQSYKDRGLDIKLKLLGEGRLRPAVAVGLRDFLGTGIFQSEYVVLSKEVGPVDLSFGMGWGNLGTRGHFRNPLTFISDSFRRRERFEPGVDLGGTLQNSYFKGDRVALFGGLQYELPVKGLSLKAEYDPISYQEEALGNRFPVKSPINVSLDYKPTTWLQTGVGLERGNRIGVRLAITTNFNRKSRTPKFDPPPPPLSSQPDSDATPQQKSSASVAASQPPLTDGTLDLARPDAIPPESEQSQVMSRLSAALATQGSALYGANIGATQAEIFVVQGRYRNVATGIGRISRAAFSALPERIARLRVVIVESGMEAMAVEVYRFALQDALSDKRALEQAFIRTEVTEPPLTLDDVSNRGPALNSGSRFYYWIRPGLRTTLGRPEQFVLYQLWARLHGLLEISRGFDINGSVGVNISDNFEKLVVPSDSVLPRVRSDIKEYLREGRTAITHLQADYNFNVAPAVYGHVYGGLLEEMFAGVGGELLYRPVNSNFAIGVDLNWVKQRDYDQWFDLRNYKVVTGHVTGYYNVPQLNLLAKVKVGRYLAKDYGATFDLSRTFKSGVTVGAFATFTDVSAAEFGEGSFDKGLYITIPLDLLYTRSVRSGVGVLWRPLIRDGGQALIIRRPLYSTLGESTERALRRDWTGLID